MSTALRVGDYVSIQGVHHGTQPGVLQQFGPIVEFHEHVGKRWATLLHDPDYITVDVEQLSYSCPGSVEEGCRDCDCGS